MATEIKQISSDKALKQLIQKQSQAIQAGSHIFVSGQIPARPDGTLVEGSIGDKTAACIDALGHILEAAGSSLDRIVKNTIFITDMADFAEMNATYAKYFDATRPARSCVAVKELPRGVAVEIEAIALAGKA